jgi:hypothetical protein
LALGGRVEMTKFTANKVEVFREVFSDDFTVFSIFFEEFDPEEGGESWNFQRALGTDGKIESLGEDDDGVCTVKEIQQVTIYEGIQKVELSQTRLICEFDPETIKDTGTDALEINYEISGDTWDKLREMAALVFKKREYFKIT